MKKPPFSREILRGVVLGAVILFGMLLGISMYHSSGVSAQPVAPAPVVSAVEETPPALAPEIVPPVKSEAPVAPPPPSIGKRTRPPKAATPQEPVMTVTIHQEDTVVPEPAPAPEASPAPVEEQAAAAPPEDPKEPPEAATESAKPKQENRGMRWIKSIGRRLHIGGK